MIDTLFSILIGIAVCMFALWCYIKGEQNGIRLANKEQPQQIETPTQVISDGVEAVKEHIERKKETEKILSMSEQIQNMRKY